MKVNRINYEVMSVIFSLIVVGVVIFFSLRSWCWRWIIDGEEMFNNLELKIDSLEQRIDALEKIEKDGD